MTRHIFRLTSYKNLPTFLEDGAVWAKNHIPMQRCYQTSYADIVDRRGGSEFQTPCFAVLNDFVPFYFSPITAMANAIYNGKVSLRNCEGNIIGTAKSEKIVFLVSNTQHFENSQNKVYFTNVACNSLARIPKFESDLGKLSTHINWNLFDEDPLKARIPEIGYNGACKYFFDRDDGKHNNRSSQRMAEFLVKNEVSFSKIDCIITNNNSIKDVIEAQIAASTWNIPVYTKLNCYF